MIRNVSNMPLPLLRNEIFDATLLIENTGNNLRYVSGICGFTAILLMDKVLILPKFAKKLMIIQIIQA